MISQERDLITTLLTRLKSVAGAGQPKDPEAEALIRQAVAEQPDAPYFLVQTALIQDLSLHQAQQRIAELQQQVEAANAQKSSGTSFLGGLFGHREPAPAAPPPVPIAPAGPWSRGPNVAPPAAGPGYAQPGYGQQGYGQQGYAPQPGYAPGGMMGGFGGAAGGGFLRSAAATAAGVAGGALLFEGISSLFGHGYASGLSGGGGFAPGVGESVINNYYGDAAQGGDYGGGGDYAGGADPGDAGGDVGGGGDYGGDAGGDAGGGDFGGGGGDDFGGGGDISC
jgi:hypothetical protein